MVTLQLFLSSPEMHCNTCCFVLNGNVQTVRANRESSSIYDYTGYIYIRGDTVGQHRKYEGKSLNSRNFILKCVEKYTQWKLLFWDTKWLLSNMPYKGGDDRAAWAWAIPRTTWPIYCQLSPWKSNEALFVFFLWSEGVKPKIYRRMKVQYGGSCLSQGRMYEWVERFQNGRQNISDEHRSGRTVSMASETVKKQVKQGIRKPVDRWTMCVAKQGYYVEK